MAAVSGGSDSMAMLAVLRNLGVADGTLVVAHLNHRLRSPASDRDALFVAASARAMRLSCVIGEPAASPRRENAEAWGRRVRYRFLARVRQAVGGAAGAAIAVAHTRDDQAETVLLRLARGAGPRALASMVPRREDGVVRPLLDRTRSECASYLDACGGLSVHDATNADTSRLRSRARHVVLPALEDWLGVDVRDRLARLASDLRVECTLAERSLAALLPAPGAGLPIAAIAAAGAAAPRLVHGWLARAEVRAGERSIASVVGLARGGSPSAGADLGSGFRVERRYDVLEIVGPSGERSPASDWAPVVLAIPGPTLLPSGWRLTADWLEPDVLPASDADGERLGAVLPIESLRLPLVARPCRPGDRIRLARGRRKVSDLLIDARIPRRDRAGLFVVTDPDDILVWIPGVRMTRAADVGHAEGRRLALAAQRL